jgi:hypothetical protein
LYGAIGTGHHLVALTEKLTADELWACSLAHEITPGCICWYSTPDSAWGYGYCSVAERSPLPDGTSVHVDVPYSGSNPYGL